MLLPFNAGPRICPTQQSAYNGVPTIIARIAQVFKSIKLGRDPNPEAKPVVARGTANGRKAIEKVCVKSHMTIYAKGGVWVKIGEADVG